MTDHEASHSPSGLTHPVFTDGPPIADRLGGGIGRLRGISPWHFAAPRIITFLVLGASAIGLLSTPIGDYDDSLMLVGARLVGVGKTPYIDFYTHYGPFGFTLLLALVHLFGQPGLALRIGEITLLAGIAILIHVLCRSLQPRSLLREYTVPILVVAFSLVAAQPAFFGFGLATAALVLFLLARCVVTSLAAVLLNVTAGGALAAAAMTRPAFAGYSVAALLLLEVAAGRPRFGALRNPISTFAVLFGSAAFTILLAWLFLYSKIQPAVALNAAVITPAYLMGAGGARYLQPGFLRDSGTVRGLARGISTGAALAAITITWMIAVRRPRTRWPSATYIVAGGLLPLLLTFSEHPGRDASLLAVSLLILAGSVAFGLRLALKECAILRASATFGIAATAFGHYFWARSDSAHLVPLLTLALVGAALVLASLSLSRRLAFLGLLLFTIVSALRPFFLPAAKLLKSDILANLRPWRCTVFPVDARDAVTFADSHAHPRSRFVAVGSTQAWSSGDPIELFLISARLPYTRWYHYDPGLQSSAAIQKEMERELEASGSQSAVVWKAHHYLFDRERPDIKARSQFDDFFDRLYPITAARFGDYVVRTRAPGASPLPGAGVAR